MSFGRNKVLISLLLMVACQAPASDSNLHYRILEKAQSHARLHILEMPKAAFAEGLAINVLIGPQHFYKSFNFREFMGIAGADTLALTSGTFLTGDNILRSRPRGLLLTAGELYSLSSSNPNFTSLLQRGSSFSIGEITTELTMELSGQKKVLQLNAFEDPELPVVLAHSLWKFLSAEMLQDYEAYFLKSAAQSGLRLSEATLGKSGALHFTFTVAAESDQTGLVLLLPRSAKTKLANDAELSVALKVYFAGLEGKCSDFPSNDLRDYDLILSGGHVLLLDAEGGVGFGRELLRENAIQEAKSGLCWNAERFFALAGDGVGSKPAGFLAYISGWQSSLGMTTYEFAEAMRSDLKCKCALQLDGGSSVSVAVGGALVNEPADFFLDDLNVVMQYRKANKN